MDYKTQEFKREQPLFETDKTKYFVVVTETYSPITGGLGVDLSLRRLEVEQGDENEKGDVISTAPIETVSQ